MVPAFIPSTVVRDDGTIGVAFYGFRSDTLDPNTRLTDYCLATSTDGVTRHARRIASPFNLAQAPLASNDQFFLVDYEGLASIGTTFVPGVRGAHRRLGVALQGARRACDRRAPPLRRQ